MSMVAGFTRMKVIVHTFALGFDFSNSWRSPLIAKRVVVHEIATGDIFP